MPRCPPFSNGRRPGARPAAAAARRSACRACHEPIAKDTWRLRLAIFEDGRWSPAGFVHARCAAGYFETDDLLARVLPFAPALDEAQVAELARELAATASGA